MTFIGIEISYMVLPASVVRDCFSYSLCLLYQLHLSLSI
jgi:hypothetical protein